MEPVSPELVLVDPTLADRSRSRLADPVDTLARVDALVEASRRASLARRSLEIPRRPVSGRREPNQRVTRAGRRRTAAFVGGVAAGTLVLALLIGVRVDLRGTPAGADTAPVVEPPAAQPPAAEPPAITPPAAEPPIAEPPAVEPPAITPPAAEPPAPTVPQTPPGAVELPPRTPVGPGAAGKPDPQRFAWAPAPGASAYHVELFRGSSKVFEADTRRPAITIPPQWKFGGRTRSLEPAEYRWNVWPVFAGRRAARAIVQAKFVASAP